MAKFQEANLLLRTGKLEEAVAAYRAATEENTSFYAAYQNLGETLWKLGRLDEAIAAFRQAVALNPSGVWCVYPLGELLRQRGEFEEAVKYLRRAVELKSDVAEFHLRLGAALVKLGELKEGEGCLRRVLQFSTSSIPTVSLAEAYYFLGVIKSEQQQGAEAVDWYRRGWEIHPGSVDCCLALAKALGLLGRWDEAVDCYRQVAVLAESGEVLFALGQALAQLQRWEEAIAEYQRAIGLGFAGAEVRHHLGYAFSQLGRYEEAVVELRQVVEVNPKSAQVRHQLGYGLMQLGRWREAALELRKAVELHPGSAVVWQQLGDVLRELGENEEAEEADQNVSICQTYSNKKHPKIPHGLPPESHFLFEQAQSATQENDWSEAANCWRKLWKTYGNRLPSETLVLISNELFKLDAFTEAGDLLEQVLTTQPNHPAALQAQKDQYCYHAYSSWLMETVEGMSDWYKSDGLLLRPDWNTAVKLCKRFLKTDARKNSPGAISQYVRTNLLLAEEYWKRKDSNNAIIVVQDVINSFGKSLPISLINSIITLLETLRENHNNSGEKLINNIQQEIHNTSTETLSVNEWLFLNDVLNWNGLFKCGFAARQKAIEQAYQQGYAQPNNITALMVAARAAIDQGDFTAANRFINKLAKTNCNSQQLSELRAYKYLQEGDIEGFKNSWPYPAKLTDLRFQEYIRGKSVAVVGPTPTSILDGEEIDSFDVVIRFNYRGEESIGDSREYGTKTNVSLYNAHTIRYFVAHNQLDILSNLDFSLIRRPRHDVDDLGWDKNKIRLIYETDNIFYKSLNAAPAVLFDVLLQGADKVKLFKTNFYLTSQHHSEKYRGRNETDFAEFPLRKIQPVLANHDLVSQVGLTRNLWDLGLISVDNQCANILNLSTEDYLFRMEKMVVNSCSLQLNDMEQAIEYAELAIYQNDWSEAIKKLKFVLDLYSDIAPEKIYRLMSRALSAQGDYKEAELTIKKGIAKYPNEINLFVQLAQVAYDKKDWSKIIVCWNEILIQIDKVKNKKLVKKIKKQAYKNIASAYGNLNNLIESAHFFERFLQISEISHQLKPDESSIISIQHITTKKEDLNLLALVDDDSTLFTLSDAISDFESCGYQVSVVQIVHKYGAKLSERQISSSKLNNQKVIKKIYLQELIEDQQFLCQFDALLLCKHSDIFRQSFYRMNTRQRPCIVSFYPGVDFFPVMGISNRIFSDIICFNSNSDIRIYEKVVPAMIQSKKAVFQYNPKFSRCTPSSVNIKNSKPIKNVYFLAQSIVPFYNKQRLDLFNTLNKCASQNSNINLKIKLRHMPGENQRHSHIERLPYTQIAQQMNKGVPKNLSFSTETMDEVFDNADLCITCSSTAGIETAMIGIPTLFYLDFLEAEADPITGSALNVFKESGLLCTKNDILSLNIKQPNIDWVKGFLPESNAINKVVESIKKLRGYF